MGSCICCETELKGTSSGRSSCVVDGADLMNRDGLYAWITPKESLQIAQLRELLTAAERDQLESSPEDFRHDLMLCRFIRGHGPEMPKVLEALKDSLRFRLENHETIMKARALFPPDHEDYSPDVCLHWELFSDAFIQLQRPGRRGSNNGMPLSCLVLRFFSLAKFSSLPEQEMTEWFLSCVEQRCLCLHKQSIRERRMARVSEVRDMLGFAWSQLFANPAIMRKFARVFKCGDKYPELMDYFIAFNLRPGGSEARLFNLAIRAFPQKFRDRVLLVDARDWQGQVEHPRGFSDAFIVDWATHLQEVDAIMNCSRHNVVTNASPQMLRVFPIEAGTSCEWKVRYQDSSCKASVSIAIRFISRLRPGKLPQVRSCGAAVEKEVATMPGEERSYGGTFSAPEDGVVLVDCFLQAGASARLCIELGGRGHFSIPVEDANSSRACGIFAGADAELVYRTNTAPSWYACILVTFVFALVYHGIIPAMRTLQSVTPL